MTLSTGLHERNAVAIENLARYTTLRVGGPATIVHLQTTDDLPELIAAQPRWLGRGANLLVGDDGVAEPVVKLGDAFSEMNIGEITDGKTLVTVGAACDLAKLVNACARAGLAGPEGLAGVPATVGGALRMNAGTVHCWMFDFVSRVQVIRPGDDQAVWLAGTEVPAVYRSSGLPAGTVFLACELQLESGDPEALRARSIELKQKKAATQPLALRSAGCSFKNPSQALPAGKLVDELGLKGRRIGDAEVSDIHANFIVNRGAATANDVCALIREIRRSAWDQRQIALELEVETWNCAEDLHGHPTDQRKVTHG